MYVCIYNVKEPRPQFPHNAAPGSAVQASPISLHCRMAISESRSPFPHNAVPDSCHFSPPLIC